MTVRFVFIGQIKFCHVRNVILMLRMVQFNLNNIIQNLLNNFRRSVNLFLEVGRGINYTPLRTTNNKTLFFFFLFVFSFTRKH